MFCRYVQWSISRSLDCDKKLSGFAKRHIAKCSYCKAFYETSLELDKRLPGVFLTSKRLADRALPQGIIGGLNWGHSLGLLGFRVWRGRILAAAAVAAILFAGGLIWMQVQPVQEVAPRDAGSDIDIVWRDLVSMPRMIAADDAAANPLDGEMESLANEAEDIADFLLKTLMIDS